MKIHPLTVGPLQENCYVVQEGEQCVIVDPGDEAPRIEQTLKRLGLTPEAIWLTHAHFDHIGAVPDLVEAWGLPVWLHPADLDMYNRAPEIAARWGFSLPPMPQPSGLLQAGQALPMGFEVLFLPGHAPGHVGFYHPTHHQLLSGDVLFKGGIGRYDLPGSDFALLKASLMQLLSLPPQTQVWPGHGLPTTLAHEQQTNPFLLGLE